MIKLFKDWWSSVSFWLKGGIIGVIIAILSYFASSIPFLGLFSALEFFVAIIAGIILSNIFGTNNEFLFTGNHEINIGVDTTITGTIFLIFIVLLIYFSVGAFIGFVIGKIKNRFTKSY